MICLGVTTANASAVSGKEIWKALLMDLAQSTYFLGKEDLEWPSSKFFCLESSYTKSTRFQPRQDFMITAR